MFSKSFSALPLLSCSLVAALAAWQDQVSIGIGDVRAVLRPATEADLDDFVDVYIEAFKPGPVWQYVMKNDKKYEEYTWSCTRKIVQAEWAGLDQSTHFVNVIAIPTSKAVEQRSERVVSIAVWKWEKPENNSATLYNMPSILRTMHSNCSEQLDMNTTRFKDFSEKLARAEDPYFGGGITETRLWLALLATHPDWDGHGFGAAQVEIGLQKATEANKSIQLLASPAGYPLYNSLGFRSLGNITVEMLDGLGTLWQECMRWDSRTK